VIRFRFAELRVGVTRRQIYGSALLGGIGFTTSLFVADLAIQDQQLLGFSKAGILAASALCAAVGYYFLRTALNSPPNSPITQP
jgi:NhaA family Na+:H+ antiporter